MNRIEIRALIQEKSEWCVSVIIPTHRTSPDRRVDTEVLHKSISQTKDLLSKKKVPVEIHKSLVESLDKLVREFDPVHATEGLGLFVSPDVSRLVHFPFPVKEKIIIDKTFETRDLYYLEQYAKPYYLLNLSKNEAHLFLLETGTLAREITNTHFPMRIENDYEYAIPTLGTSFGFSRKGFEKDKSIMNKMRMETFFKSVQENLMPFIKAGDLLVTGAKNILSEFDTIRDKKLRIKGRVVGSFRVQNEMFERARASYFECRHHEIQSLIDGIEELVGTKKATYGIRDVWSAAKAGKGDVLLVEKDFRKVGYSLESGQQVSLNVPLVKHSTLPDLVDELIETIIDKGGRVVFTEEHQLDKYDQIALILRY
jgi:Bacterial archaeo-eukaryotic release factor family 3